MIRNVGTILAALATIMLGACDGVVTNQGSSEHPPLIELPTPTVASTLDDLVSYYRDRERLMARDAAAAALARSWGRGMTVDEALEYTDEVMEKLIWIYHAMRFSEDPELSEMSWGDAKATIAETIADRMGVTVEKVEGDIAGIGGWERIKVWYPDVTQEDTHGYWGCEGDVRLTRTTTSVTATIHTRNTPNLLEIHGAAWQSSTQGANHDIYLDGEVTGDIGYSFFESDGHDQCSKRQMTPAARAHTCAARGSLRTLFQRCSQPPPNEKDRT